MPHTYICGLQLLVLTFSFSTLEFLFFFFVTEDIILCNRSQHFVFHPAPAKSQFSVAWLSPQEGVRDMQLTAFHGASEQGIGLGGQKMGNSIWDRRGRSRVGEEGSRESPQQPQARAEPQEPLNSAAKNLASLPGYPG